MWSLDISRPYNNTDRPVSVGPQCWLPTTARCWTRTGWCYRGEAEGGTTPESTSSTRRNPATRSWKHTLKSRKRRESPIYKRQTGGRTASICDYSTNSMLASLLWSPKWCQPGFRNSNKCFCLTCQGKYLINCRALCFQKKELKVHTMLFWHFQLPASIESRRVSYGSAKGTNSAEILPRCTHGTDAAL